MNEQEKKEAIESLNKTTLVWDDSIGLKVFKWHPEIERAVEVLPDVVVRIGEQHMVQEQQQSKKQFGQRVAQVTYLPLDDKCVVYILQAPNTTEGGIVVPERSKEDFITTRVKVIAVGPDVKRVKVGDVCLVGIHGTVDGIKHRGQETLVLAENQFYGVEIPEIVDVEKAG